MPVDILYIGFVLGHGGDAMQMLELAAGMVKRGKRVRAIVPDLPTTIQFARLGASRCVDVVRTNLIHVDPVASRQEPAKLSELFRSHPAQLLHLHTGDFCLSRSVPRVLGELQIPADDVIVTVHSPYDTLAPEHDRAVAWANAAETRIRCIVCPSHHALLVQRKYGVPEQCLAHIPNGIDLDRFQCGNSAKVRAELNLIPEEPLIVFTSRLDSQKRPVDALSAFNRISSEFQHAHIAFVGTGEFEADLRNRAACAGLDHRVHLMGHRQDVPDWLAAADVWLLPTEIENFSMAILEALAAGCPILSTYCSGNEEVLVPEENALVHSVGDIEAIAVGIRRLLSTPALRTRLSANARQTAQRFGADVMVKRYEQLYYRQ